jgi:hypothetical protein
MRNPALRRLVLSAVAGAVAVTGILTFAAIAPAKAATSQRALSVTIEGSGVVRSSDRRIACGTRCTARYRTGRDVTLTPTALPNFVFTGWTAGCIGAAPTCIVTMDEATAVRALFTRERAQVAVTVGGAGRIFSGVPGISCQRSADAAGGCAAQFGRGDTIRLVAVPAAGAALAFWGGACQGTSGSVCDITVENDTSVFATFRAAEPGAGLQQISVDASNGASATSTPAGIDCPRVCSMLVASGTSVTLQRPAGNSGWGGACAGESEFCTVVVDGPTVVAVSLWLMAPGDAYPLHVTRGGSKGGGQIVGGGLNCTGRSRACSKTFGFGKTVSLTARAARGHKFKRWVGQRSCAKRPICRVTVVGQMDITAVFGRSRR